MGSHFFSSTVIKGSKLVNLNVNVLFCPRTLWFLVTPNVQSVELLKMETRHAAGTMRKFK